MGGCSVRGYQLHRHLLHCSPWTSGGLFIPIRYTYWCKPSSPTRGENLAGQFCRYEKGRGQAGNSETPPCEGAALEAYGQRPHLLHHSVAEPPTEKGWLASEAGLEPARPASGPTGAYPRYVCQLRHSALAPPAYHPARGGARLAEVPSLPESVEQFPRDVHRRVVAQRLELPQHAHAGHMPRGHAIGA